MNFPDTQFGVQLFCRRIPRPVADVAPQVVQDIPVQPAFASAQESVYVAGFDVSFCVHVRIRVGVAAPAVVGVTVAPSDTNGAIRSAALATAMAREFFRRSEEHTSE